MKTKKYKSKTAIISGYLSVLKKSSAVLMFDARGIL
jgi:ribosomal protein L10